MKHEINPINLSCCILTFLLLILTSFNNQAQVAVKFLQIRPAGNLGMLFEKTYTGEIMYRHDFEKRFSPRVGITYADFSPRLDTFPLTLLKEEGAKQTVIPGFLVISTYNLYFLFAGLDYNLVKKEHFFLYPGIDFLTGFSKLGFDQSYETISDGSYYSDGGTFAGLRFRAGAKVKLLKYLGLFMEATKTIYYSDDLGLSIHNDFGIGLHMDFN